MLKKKPKPVQKARKPSVFRLKKKLRPIYSAYIRLLYSDKDGMVACMSCGDIHIWSGTSKIHNGHFFSKKYYSCIEFEELNTHPICSICNRVQSSGEGYRYYLNLVKKYGAEAIQSLYEKGCKKIPYTAEQLQEKIKWYTTQLKLLKQQKGL